MNSKSNKKSEKREWKDNNKLRYNMENEWVIMLNKKCKKKLSKLGKQNVKSLKRKVLMNQNFLHSKKLNKNMLNKRNKSEPRKMPDLVAKT